MEEHKTRNPNTSIENETEKVLFEGTRQLQNGQNAMAKNEPDSKLNFAASDRTRERSDGACSPNGIQMKQENQDDEQVILEETICHQGASAYREMTILHREEKQEKYDQSLNVSKDDFDLKSDNGGQNKQDENVQENLKYCKKSTDAEHEKVHIGFENEKNKIEQAYTGPKKLGKGELFSLNFQVRVTINVFAVGFQYEPFEVNGSSENIVLLILRNSWIRQFLLESEPFRYATFSRSNGSTDRVSIMDLARNGFFYDIDHHVRCYFCNAVFNVTAPVAVVHDQDCQVYESMVETFADYGPGSPEVLISNRVPPDVLSAVSIRSEECTLIHAACSGCPGHRNPVVQETHTEEAAGSQESCTFVDIIPDPDILNHVSSGSQPSEEFSSASMIPVEENPRRQEEYGYTTHAVAVETTCQSDITRLNDTDTRGLLRENEAQGTSATHEPEQENEVQTRETIVTESIATVKSSSATNLESHADSSTNRSEMASASSESNFSGKQINASSLIDVRTKRVELSRETSSDKDDIDLLTRRSPAKSKAHGNNCDTRESGPMSGCPKHTQTSIEQSAKNKVSNEREARRPVNSAMQSHAQCMNKTKYRFKVRKFLSKHTVVPLSKPTFVPTKDQPNHNSKSSDNELGTAFSPGVPSDAMISPGNLNTLGACASPYAEISRRTYLANIERSRQLSTSNRSHTTGTSNSRSQELDSDFSSRRRRIESFQQCSQFEQTPQEMALAGLYYTGNGNSTVCYQCGGRIQDWESGDDPVEKHNKKFPECHLSKGREDSDDFETEGATYAPIQPNSPME